jgi:hypothetical protein
LLALLVVLPALTAGCGGGGTATRPVSSVPRTRSATPASSRPRIALRRLIDAAGSNDAAGMWTTLSLSTRRQLGPTLADFRAGSAGPLSRQLAPLAAGMLRVFLEERITETLAVAAVSRPLRVAGRRRLLVYGAAVRLEAGGWRVVIDPSLLIKATLPQPRRRVYQRTKVLAEVAARAPVSAAALWFDGRAFPAEGAGPDPEHVGLLGEAPQPLHDGPHTVVVFATAGPSAGARAWTFDSYGGPYRKSLAPLGP